MSARRPFKVVQWATGAMGKACLRAVIDRSDMELAGLFAYGKDKAGKDAGEIARRDLTGVIATGDVNDILALDADVVIHAARLRRSHDAHDPDILRLLRSGKNVISINGGTYPPFWSEKRRDIYEKACCEGGASFMGAGLNPGFAAEKLLATASGLCIRVDAVSLLETVICSEVKSPEYVFDLLGFGSEPGALRLDDDSWEPAVTLNAMYEEVVAGTAARFGWPLDGVTRKHRMLPAQEDMKIAAGVIRKGQTSHVDWRWRGVVGGQERIALSIAWAMDATHFDAPHPPLWRLEIEGEPRVALDLALERSASTLGRVSAEQLAVAGAVMNAVPYVVDAPPGLLASNFPTPWRDPAAWLKNEDGGA